MARNGRKTATYYAAYFLPHYRRVLFSHLLVFNLCYFFGYRNKFILNFLSFFIRNYHILVNCVIWKKILLYHQTWTSITQTEINDNIPTLHNVVHTENSHGAYNVCDTHFDQIFILFINVLLKLSFCLPFIYQKPQIRGQLRYLQSNNIDLWLAITS